MGSTKCYVKEYPINIFNSDRICATRNKFVEISDTVVDHHLISVVRKAAGLSLYIKHSSGSYDFVCVCVC